MIDISNVEYGDQIALADGSIYWITGALTHNGHLYAVCESISYSTSAEAQSTLLQIMNGNRWSLATNNYINLYNDSKENTNLAIVKVIKQHVPKTNRFKKWSQSC